MSRRRLTRPDALSGVLGAFLGLLQGGIVAVVADLGEAFGDQLGRHVFGLLGVGGAEQDVAVVTVIGRVGHRSQNLRQALVKLRYFGKKSWRVSRWQTPLPSC